MENKDIINFSKFFESDFSTPSSFKKEDFNDFFLSEEVEKEDDEFLINTFDEIEEREKAKDFAQDAFVVLWNQRKDLNIKIGLKPYLRQVVVNKCLNHLRREERLDFSENSNLPETITTIDAIHHLEKEDLQKTVQIAVDQLPNRCRIIFCMSRYEEKSHKEISQELGIKTKKIEKS